jgi:hypothetical protein
MLDFLKGIFGGSRKGADVAAAAQLADLGLPFEAVLVPGKNALETRRLLKQRGDITPVIMGKSDDLRLVSDLLRESTESVESIMSQAAQVDVDSWMRSKIESDPENYRVETEEWPVKPSGQPGLSVHLEVLSRRSKKNVIVGLIPTTEAWQAPAYLRYGDWNDCPPAAIHVAMHKRWSEKYGSVIACMTDDIVECVVNRPPSTREEALALALEQFVYCPDIVHQGVGSVGMLAASLLDCRTWYFWWD